MPKPPGIQINACDSLTSISFRVKKYRIETYLSSPAIIGFAEVSNGRRILTPIDISRPAPDIPASIIPGPAPVTTIHPSSAKALATCSVNLYSGSSLVVRADPKIVTFFRSVYGANIAKASRISVRAALAIFRFKVFGLSRASCRAEVSISVICFRSNLAALFLSKTAEVSRSTTAAISLSLEISDFDIK